MRWISAITWGALFGTLLLLAFYGLTLLILSSRLGGDSDAISAAILDRDPGLIGRTVLKFLFLNLLAGGVLGAVSAVLAEVVIAPGPRSRFIAYAGASISVFLYLNIRFMVLKPMFYDPLLNARGGAGRWLQNLLTHAFSPRGVDIVFVLFCVALLLLRRRGVKRTGLAVAACAATGALFLLPNRAGVIPGTLDVNRPNILLIESDSLRPDHLSCNGYPRPTSPNIDGVAEKGIVFNEAYVPVARTLPSWASLLTSTYPHTHGFRHMFPAPERRRIRLPSLTEILSEAGYDSAVVSDYAGECFGMVDMGFDIVDVPPTTSIAIVIEREFMRRQPYLGPFFDNAVGHRLLPLLGFLMINPDPDHMAERVKRAMRTLHDRGRPFFISAFFSCTHIPYALPHPFYEMFTDPAYQGIHKYGFGIQDVRDIDKAAERPPDEDQGHIIDLYDGGVAAFDYAVGRVLDELEHLGIADNTLIIISSDHGENLYDNGNLLEHGERFGGGDAANRIPLILLDPRGDFAARRIETQVDILDLAPTLLELLSLPVPPTARGRSLLPLMEGDDGTGSRHPYLFSETGLRLWGTPDEFQDSGIAYPSILSALEADPSDGTLYLKPEYEARMVAAKHRQIRDGKFKLIYEPTHEGADFHLYDVIADPGNGRDLYGLDGYEEITGRLKRALFEWMLKEPGGGLDARLHLVPKYTFFE